MKKAITIQFNWIFVLIAGALILVFFGSIVMKQRDLSERSISQDTVMKLEKKFGVSITAIGKAEEMEFQDKELIMSCNELRSGKATTILADPVFSPERVEGAKLITLTKAFKMPFHVTNFLYITSNSVRYILVHGIDSKEIAEEIQKGMGDKVNLELVTSLADVEDFGHYKTKIVFVKTTLHTAENLKKGVTAVQILDNNELKFLRGKTMDMDGESFYFDNETIMAAVFAENKENYECGLRKAVKKLNMMSDLYIRRTLAVGSSQEIDQDCKDFYPQAGFYLSRIKQDLEALPASLNKLKDNVNGLEAQNNLLIMNSCPEIY